MHVHTYKLLASLVHSIESSSTHGMVGVTTSENMSFLRMQFILRWHSSYTLLCHLWRLAHMLLVKSVLNSSTVTYFHVVDDLNIMLAYYNLKEVNNRLQ